MEKVIIIGCPGSGKSTFARKLREHTGLPLYYLDMMFWNEDRTTVSRDEFDKRLETVLKTDRWIIDGNYGRTMEKRFEHCDTVFFLDIPTEVCLDGIRSRQGRPREDMPWVETEQDAEFEQFVKDFVNTSRPKIISLIEKYSDKQIAVFRSHEESERYLAQSSQQTVD